MASYIESVFNGLKRFGRYITGHEGHEERTRIIYLTIIAGEDILPIVKTEPFTHDLLDDFNVSSFLLYT